MLYSSQEPDLLKGTEQPVSDWRQPQHRSCLIYTPGLTGRSKGVGGLGSPLLPALSLVPLSMAVTLEWLPFDGTGAGKQRNLLPALHGARASRSLSVLSALCGRSSFPCFQLGKLRHRDLVSSPGSAGSGIFNAFRDTEGWVLSWPCPTWGRGSRPGAAARCARCRGLTVPTQPSCSSGPCSALRSP